MSAVPADAGAALPGVAADGAPPDEALTPAQVVRVRYTWYRDGFRLLLTAQLVTLALLCVFVATTVYFYRHVPAPDYFATTQDGRLIPLQPLNRPVFAPNAVLQWAVDSVVEANDYSFRNYREHLQKVCNRRFTYRGCGEFQQALSDSRNLAAVKTFGLVVSAQATRAPIISTSGLEGERFYWVVQVPALLTVESTQQHKTQAQVVTLKIVRVSTLDSEYGIAIDQYIAEFGQVGP